MSGLSPHNATNVRFGAAQTLEENGDVAQDWPIADLRTPSVFCREIGAPMNRWSLYKVKNAVVVPHELLFNGGPLFEVPPFRKFNTKAPDFEERLAQLFRDPNLTTLPRKYSREEAPDRDRVHFLNSLGVRSERELGRRAQLWTVEEKAEVFNVELWIESPSRGFEIDRATTDAFEKNMRLERLTTFLLEKLS